MASGSSRLHELLESGEFDEDNEKHVEAYLKAFAKYQIGVANEHA